MREGVKARFPYERNHDPLETTVPVYYSVDYKWGALHVSPAAHEAYGLFSQTLATLPDLPQRKTEPMPQVHVLLLAPGEGKSETTYYDGAHSELTLHKGGIDIKAWLSQDKEQVGRRVLEDAQRAAQEHALPGEQIVLLGPEGEPFEATLQLQVPDFIIHALSEELSVALANGVESWLLHNESKIFLRDVHFLGGVALGMSIATVGVASTDIHRISVASAAPVTALYVGLLYKRIRSFAAEADLRADRIENFAGKFAGMAANMVHTNFCRSHFDPSQPLGGIE